MDGLVLQLGNLSFGSADGNLAASIRKQGMTKEPGSTYGFSLQSSLCVLSTFIGDEGKGKAIFACLDLQVGNGTKRLEGGANVCLRRLGGDTRRKNSLGVNFVAFSAG